MRTPRRSSTADPTRGRINSSQRKSSRRPPTTRSKTTSSLDRRRRAQCGRGSGQEGREQSRPFLFGPQQPSATTQPMLRGLQAQHPPSTSEGSDVLHTITANPLEVEKDMGNIDDLETD